MSTLEAELEFQKSPNEADHEMIAEMLAQKAAVENDEGQAQAILGAAAITVLSARDHRALVRFLPHLIRAMAILTHILRRQRRTRPAVRAVPTIVRRTVRSLNSQAAAGVPVTQRALTGAATTQARQVLANPSLWAAGISGNLRINRNPYGSAFFEREVGYNLGGAAAFSRETDRRFKRVAALLTNGLNTAKAAIPQLTTHGQKELLRFMTSLLGNFFPRGHGLIDAQAKVLRQSQRATVQINVTGKDGSLWPFEHRARLYLSDQTGFRKRGEHLEGHFSSIRLFTREFNEATPSRAVLVALHEMTHMMFAMIRRFEQRFGAETAARLLSRQPWRLLVLTGFAAHRERLERRVSDLLQVLPIPMRAAGLAASLIEETFAAIFETMVGEAIAQSPRATKGRRGDADLLTYDFSPPNLISYYVLERGFAVTKKQLASRQAQQIFEEMTNDVAAMASALRAHLDT
jgi:hypothetical protein